MRKSILVLFPTLVVIVVAYFVISKLGVATVTYNGYSFDYNNSIWVKLEMPTVETPMLKLTSKSSIEMVVSFSGVRDTFYPPVHLDKSKTTEVIRINDETGLWCGKSGESSSACRAYNLKEFFNEGYLIWYGDVMGKTDVTFVIRDFAEQGGDGSISETEISESIELIDAVLSAKPV